MKTPANLQCTTALAATLAMGLLAPAGSTAQDRQHRVEIHGRVLVDDNARTGSLEVVEVDNRRCIPLTMHPDGRFELVLDPGDQAYLRFEKEGYLTKEVLVDTRNANITPAAAKRNKDLRFAVQMAPQLPDKQLAYAGPVGSITFLKGSGLMKVQYNRSLARTSTGDIVALDGPATPGQHR